MGWAEAMLAHRASDDPLNFLGAALLAQDQVLFRLAATWPRVRKKLPPEPGPGEEINLDALWSEVIVDFEEWAVIARMTPLAAMTGFEVLKQNRIIFPPHYLSHQAEAVLKKAAASRFMAATGIREKDLK